MRLMAKLPLLKYWKLEEVFKKNEGKYLLDLDDEEYKTSTSGFKNKLFRAIDLEEIETHKFKNDAAVYLLKDDVYEWFFSIYRVTLDNLLDLQMGYYTDDKPDYIAFSNAAHNQSDPHNESALNIHTAFCYLVGIPITRGKSLWSKEEKEEFGKFNEFTDGREFISPNRIKFISEKTNIPMPEEMIIVFDEYEFLKENNPQKRKHPLKKFIQEKRKEMYQEIGKDPDKEALWKRFKKIQTENNLLEKVWDDVFSWKTQTHLL